MHDLARCTNPNVNTISSNSTYNQASSQNCAGFDALSFTSSGQLNWSPLLSPTVVQTNSYLQSSASVRDAVGGGVETVSNRLKHACAIHDGCLYVFGGRQGRTALRDLCCWDGVEWTRLDLTMGPAPPCLEGHTMVAYKNHLYIFGGTYGFPDECPLWIYSIDFEMCRQWQPHSDVIVPHSRRHHTAVTYGGGMHVFGGYVDLKGSTSELWTFDFESESWHIPSGNDSLFNIPAGRHGHTAEVFASAMWIFGGLTDLVPCKNELWRWHFNIKQWSRIRFTRGPGYVSHHTSAVYQNQMFIIGGVHAQVSSDIWVFDFNQFIWKQIPQSSTRPALGPHQSLSVVTYNSPEENHSSLSRPTTASTSLSIPFSVQMVQQPTATATLPAPLRSPKQNKVSPTTESRIPKQHFPPSTDLMFLSCDSNRKKSISNDTNLVIEDLEMLPNLVEDEDFFYEDEYEDESIPRSCSVAYSGMSSARSDLRHGYDSDRFAYCNPTLSVSTHSNSPSPPNTLVTTMDTLTPDAGYQSRNSSNRSRQRDSVGCINGAVSITDCVAGEHIKKLVAQWQDGYPFTKSRHRHHTPPMLVHLGAKEVNTSNHSPLVLWCAYL